LEKFDAKSDEGIFIEYSKNSRAYQVFNRKNQVVMESINVMVEDVSPNSKNESVSLNDDEKLIQADDKQGTSKDVNTNVEVDYDGEHFDFKKKKSIFKSKEVSISPI
jgi:hypothetical protein